jgi:hypothetical protein
MNQLLQVIHNLGNNDEKFISDAELSLIRSHKEEASAYFHKTLDQLRSQDKDVSLEDSQLLNDSLFGLFFLAEWKDTTAFKKIGDILHILGEDDSSWLGDIATENLPHVLYQLFDDNNALLKQFLYDTEINTFTRISYAQIAIQKYLDHSIPLDSLLTMMRQFETIPEEDLDYEFISFICDMMTKAHICEYMPDVKKWIEKGMVDRRLVGEYADHLDLLYDYRDDVIIRTDYSLKKEAGYWFKFEHPETPVVSDAYKDIDEDFLVQKMLKEEASPYKHTGRNDPCPCGSGKKFKKCCLPLLEKSRTGGIEPPLIRFKKAQYYPELSFDPVTGLPKPGFQKVPGRMYLEDQYDKDAIEIDYYVYLARETTARKQFGEMFMDDSALDRLYKTRKQTAEAYLKKARELRSQIMARDSIAFFDKFDQKYAIHFLSDEWDDIIPSDW